MASGGFSPGRRSASCIARSHRPRLNRRFTVTAETQHLGGLHLRHPLDAHQVEDFPLVLRQLVDRPEHAEAVRGQAGDAAGRRRHEPLAQLRGGRLII